MEGGLSDRALTVLRAILHQKANVDLAENVRPECFAPSLKYATSLGHGRRLG